jgi:hypothetical protein
VEHLLLGFIQQGLRLGQPFLIRPSRAQSQDACGLYQTVNGEVVPADLWNGALTRLYGLVLSGATTNSDYGSHFPPLSVTGFYTL